MIGPEDILTAALNIAIDQHGSPRLITFNDIRGELGNTRHQKYAAKSPHGNHIRETLLKNGFRKIGRKYYTLETPEQDHAAN